MPLYSKDKNEYKTGIQTNNNNNKKYIRDVKLLKTSDGIDAKELLCKKKNTRSWKGKEQKQM